MILIDLGDPEAYFNRGLSYGRKGDKESAIADFQKALELCGASSICEAASSN